MSFIKTSQRKSFNICNGLRFCFYLLSCFTVSFAQSDSSVSFKFSAGTEYFDIFRQSSERSRTIVLSKQSYVSIASALNQDSISLSFRAIDDYAALGQTESRFNISLEHSLQTINLGYVGSVYFINYSVTLGTLLNTDLHPLMYQAKVFLTPFDPLLNAGFEVTRSPFHYNSTILFQDFFVPLGDVSNTISASYTINSTPFKNLMGTLRYHESTGNKPALQNGYGTETQYRSADKLFSVQYWLSPSTFFTTEIGTVEYRTEATFKQNNQSFGDLLSGSGKHSIYTATFQTKDLPLPLSATYSFEQLALSGVGHFESWPFTSLAASVISNRLNYQAGGLIRHHSLAATAAISFASSLLFITASYHRILPNVVLEHWEPEFLVFGMKNFTRDPISIKDAHLAGIGLQYDFSFQSATISTFAEQYVPLSTSYRTAEKAPAPNQPPVPTSTRKISTDGGRRFGVDFTFKL